MSAIVLDSSIALAWCFSDESSPLADEVLRSLNRRDAFVPAVWPLEIANIVAIGERRGRLTLAESAQFLSLLETLPIHADQVDKAVIFDKVLPLARSNSITAYDASYPELAKRMNTPLATLDKLLITAASRENIVLYQSSQ